MWSYRGSGLVHWILSSRFWPSCLQTLQVFQPDTLVHWHRKGFAFYWRWNVPTVTFRILYVFVILKHDQREVVHFNITQNPTAQWTAQQILKAFPFDPPPRYLLRDRDSIYGKRFRKRVKSLGNTEVLTAPRSPWQNPYIERLIGSIRRECVDHVIVLSAAHLRLQLNQYFYYYHDARTHLSLAKQ